MLLMERDRHTHYRTYSQVGRQPGLSEDVAFGQRAKLCSCLGTKVLGRGDTRCRTCDRIFIPAM